MRAAEPLSPFVRTLIGIGFRMLAGAALGFVCALALRAVGGTDGANITGTALSIGALLGAIYYPLAFRTLLAGENQRNATVAVFAMTFVFGMFGLRTAGPEFTATFASFGFWGACAAIYRSRRRERNRADFGSYFR